MAQQDVGEVFADLATQMGNVSRSFAARDGWVVVVVGIEA